MPNLGRSTRRAFVCLSLGWAGSLPLASLIARQPHDAFLYSIAVALYGIGAVVCHQRPERSFQLWGAQLPVCARCTGIYVGAALAVVCAMVRVARPGHGRALLEARTALLVAATPVGLTLVYEWTTGDVPANLIRACSGLPLGAVIAWIVLKVN